VSGAGPQGVSLFGLPIISVRNPSPSSVRWVPDPFAPLLLQRLLHDRAEGSHDGEKAYPDTDVCIFFMDLRAFGKGYHRYYDKARDELGIRFIRCRVPRVMQNFKTKDVAFHAVSDHNGLSRKILISWCSRRVRVRPGILARSPTYWGWNSPHRVLAAPGASRPLSPIGRAFPLRLGIGSEGHRRLAVRGQRGSGAAALLLSSAPEPDTAAPVPEAGEEKAAVIVCKLRGRDRSVIDTGLLTDFCRELPEWSMRRRFPFSAGRCPGKDAGEIARAGAAASSSRVPGAGAAKSIRRSAHGDRQHPGRSGLGAPGTAGGGHAEAKAMLAMANSRIRLAASSAPSQPASSNRRPW